MTEPPDKDKWLKQREAFLPQLNKLYNDEEVELFFGDEAGRRVCLVLDNASWHKTKRLVWHHIEPISLPPHSPDFNPIERIWPYLKGHSMAGYLKKSGVKLGEKLFEALKILLKDAYRIRSVTTVELDDCMRNTSIRGNTRCKA